MEAGLQSAYIHVSRYFRRWLREQPGGDALAEALARETLVRVARTCDLTAEPGPELIADWLSAAHAVAREVGHG